MNATVVASAEYAKLIGGLLTEDEIVEMEFSISANPEAHPIISGTGGVRKARWSKAGVGKSGGIRVIYFYMNQRGVVYKLTAFPKNRKGDLSQQERNQMYKITQALKNEAT